MADDEAHQIFYASNRGAWCDAHTLSAANVRRVVHLTGRNLIEAIVRYANV